jgi:hypothetical protein
VVPERNRGDQPATLADIGITKKESARGQPYQATGSRTAPVENQTLVEIGITKKESARAQKLAAIPEPEFRERIEAAITPSSVEGVIR